MASNNSINLKKIFKNTVIYSILIIGIIIVVYPFFIMVINSLKEGKEILNFPLALPTKLNFDGYKAVFEQLNMVRLFANSILISGSVTLLSILFSCMAAYGVTKTDLPYNEKFLDIILASMMIPGIILLIPVYTMMYNWDWINTYRVLIIPLCISPYNIFLMVQFMKGLDNAYIEAARIDGASELQIFFKVVIPMCKPAIATVAIITFMGSWNDFLNPLLYLRDDTHMTVQLAVYRFKSAIPNSNLDQLWAAFTVVTVPIVIVYLFLQKNFIKAFNGIGLK